MDQRPESQGEDSSSIIYMPGSQPINPFFHPIPLKFTKYLPAWGCFHDVAIEQLETLPEQCVYHEVFQQHPNISWMSHLVALHDFFERNSHQVPSITMLDWSAWWTPIIRPHFFGSEACNCQLAFPHLFFPKEHGSAHPRRRFPLPHQPSFGFYADGNFTETHAEHTSSFYAHILERGQRFPFSNLEDLPNSQLQAVLNYHSDEYAYYCQLIRLYTSRAKASKTYSDQACTILTSCMKVDETTEETVIPLPAPKAQSD
jgi:hypothetical protein